MNSKLHILSGGAANGLVSRLQPRFSERTGLQVAGTFSAVGQMKDALLAGEPCDLVILTQSLVEQLAASGHVDKSSLRPIGQVHTGLGVPKGQVAPALKTPTQLADALREADGIYMADGLKATAGIHFMKVLRELGLQTALGERLLGFPNGQTAMAAMADRAKSDPTLRLIGCTQVTEILNTPGVQQVGLLPPPFELATPYWAAIPTGTPQAEAAALMIDLLSNPAQEALRKACGFS
jgi:molybdate transport system substrate-binding protein